MKSKIRFEYLIVISLVIFFLFLSFQKCNEVDDLKKNGQLVQAKIIKYLSSSKGAGGKMPSFECELEFNGQKKTLISISSLLSGGISYVGKTYPALFSEKTNALRLLITEEDFKEFNRGYPESTVNDSSTDLNKVKH